MLALLGPFPWQVVWVFFVFTECKQVGSRQTIRCFALLPAIQLLLGFRLEPPVEPQREKLTLGAQAW